MLPAAEPGLDQRAESMLVMLRRSNTTYVKQKAHRLNAAPRPCVVSPSHSPLAAKHVTFRKAWSKYSLLSFLVCSHWPQREGSTNTQQTKR